MERWRESHATVPCVWTLCKPRLLRLLAGTHPREGHNGRLVYALVPSHGVLHRGSGSGAVLRYLS